MTKQSEKKRYGFQFAIARTIIEVIFNGRYDFSDEY